MKQYLYCIPHSPPSRRRFAPAFTLVEMLIVITIITILLTMGAMGLKNMAKASGVSAGLPVAEAIFSEARNIAISKGSRSRVLIHAQNDPSNPFHRDRFLRYMAVSYFDNNGTPDNTADDKWVIASKGLSLPKGVYFSKLLSEKAGLPLKTESNVNLPGGPTASATCYYYEFNAEGMMRDPLPSNNNVPRFVIGSGSLPPGATEPRGIGKNVGGFVIWRSGRTSLFRHPDQIDPSLQ